MSEGGGTASFPAVLVNSVTAGSGYVGQGSGAQVQTALLQDLDRGDGVSFIDKSVHKVDVAMSASWVGDGWSFESQVGAGEGLPCVFHPTFGG